MPSIFRLKNTSDETDKHEELVDDSQVHRMGGGDTIGSKRTKGYGNSEKKTGTLLFPNCCVG